MIKKISVIFTCFILSCCSTAPQVLNEGGAESYTTDISEIGISTSQSFRVGMLLPLTGADSKYGQGMKNASMLALNDINNPNLVIQYYDTASTPSGARVAIKNAVNQHSQLILGPLKSTEVSAISNETIYQGIPVIAFSTSPDVLQPTIYTLGLLIDEQVDRIMSHAVSQGRRRFALLLPDNNTGISTAKAAVKSAAKNEAIISVIAFYKTGTSDFSSIVKQMTDYNLRHKQAEQLKYKLKNLAASGDASAQKELKILESRDGVGDVGFDAILFPEGGVTLTAAASIFAYYDAAYPTIQFLGTSIWEAGISHKESSLQNSIYPALTKAKNNTFVSQYYSIFGEKPSSLYTLAYDAVILADRLSKQSWEGTLSDNITSVGGFFGLNGKVRFFADGTNQHSLDIVSVSSSGDKVIDSGEQYFETTSFELPAIDPDTVYTTPRIIGKDPSLAQVLIYGKALDSIPQAVSKPQVDAYIR
ncbi:MAG: penicillin-binding protein activator [Alphaproteobacteria bacterium]|nr:penicillin-binding protein activator [Alphaproteobacteria bacterium]